MQSKTKLKLTLALGITIVTCTIPFNVRAFSETISESNPVIFSTGSTINKMKYETITNLSTLPKNIVDKIDSVKMTKGFFVFTTKELGFTEDANYILISSGEKPTTGYGLTVQSLEEIKGNLTIAVHESTPEKEALTGQVLTYPYVLLKIANNTSQIHVHNQNNDPFYSLLPGDVTTEIADGMDMLPKLLQENLSSIISHRGYYGLDHTLYGLDAGYKYIVLSSGIKPCTLSNMGIKEVQNNEKEIIITAKESILSNDASSEVPTNPFLVLRIKTTLPISVKTENGDLFTPIIYGNTDAESITNLKDSPKEIQTAVEKLKKIKGYYILGGEEYGCKENTSYILICSGEKPTSEYDVAIEAVETKEDTTTITISEIKPTIPSFHSQNLTYPYSLMKITKLSHKLEVKEVIVNQVNLSKEPKGEIKIEGTLNIK